MMWIMTEFNSQFYFFACSLPPMKPINVYSQTLTVLIVTRRNEVWNLRKGIWGRYTITSNFFFYFLPNITVHLLWLSYIFRSLSGPLTDCCLNLLKMKVKLKKSNVIRVWDLTVTNHSLYLSFFFLLMCHSSYCVLCLAR